jgi:hypothetical protein
MEKGEYDIDSSSVETIIAILCAAQRWQEAEGILSATLNNTATSITTSSTRGKNAGGISSNPAIYISLGCAAALRGDYERSAKWLFRAQVSHTQSISTSYICAMMCG